MSAAARAGIIILMVLLVLTARLVETEIARVRRASADAVPDLAEPPPEPGSDLVAPDVAAAAGPAGRGAHPGAPRADVVAPDGSRAHTVAKNETLGAISKRFYGTSKHWPLILEANRDQLKKAADLRAGQTIRIPPPPAPAAPAPVSAPAPR